MIKYEEKFFVINKKHLSRIPQDLMSNFSTALAAIRPYLPDNKYYVCNQDEDYADNVLKLILYDEMKKQLSNDDSRKQFNNKELSHLAINFAVTCQRGYTGTFNEWYDNLAPDWRDVANKEKS